uniref:Uncharacterized protein n=1 Tax=viral metagenome TaxID=1070528 RepID=A0A6C0H1I6_9ZZZZ
MILIFSSVGGLCNQFYDIINAINFCVYHNYQFSFKYCEFRNKNLTTWVYEDFNKLFDLSDLINTYKNLFIDINLIKMTEENTYNFSNKNLNKLFDNTDVISVLNKIDKEYIMIPWFHVINRFRNIEIHGLNKKILPSIRLINLYNNIKNKLLDNNEKYNFIHYRYEHDFTRCFDIKIEPFKDLYLRIKNNFKNTTLKIYIATSNFKSIIDLNDIDVNDPDFNQIITKNEDELVDYNFEELAFIDFMFGKNSEEVYGHHKSSFSHMLWHITGNVLCYSN